MIRYHDTGADARWVLDKSVRLRSWPFDPFTAQRQRHKDGVLRGPAILLHLWQRL